MFFSLGRAADDVLGEHVVPTTHREPKPVLVVFEDVVRNVGIERLQHCQSSVAVIVDVVTWEKGDEGFRSVKRRCNCMVKHEIQH